MRDIDALLKVYEMAYHANDLGGCPWTDEGKEALGATRRYIEANFPLSVRILWDIHTNQARDIPQNTQRYMRATTSRAAYE